MNKPRQHYRHLLENLREGLWEIDAEGRTTFVNTAMAEMLGYTVAEIQGRRLFEFMDERGIELCQANLSRSRQGVRERLDFEFIRKDGTHIHTSLMTSPILVHGHYAGTVADVQDLTDRISTEQSLRESKVKYQELVDLLPVVVFECDLDGVLTFSNREAFRRFGYTAADFARPLNIREIVAPADWERAWQNVQRVLRGEILGGREYQVRTKTGETFMAMIYSSPIIRENQPRGLRGIIVDLTDLKRAEEQISAGLRRQIAILNNIPDIAWLKDREGRFIAVNEPFARACGLPPAAVVGKTDLDLWPRELAERYREADRQVMESGRSTRMEEPLADREKKIAWIETIKTPIFNAQGEIVGTTGIARDITSRKTAEADREKLETQLRTAQQLESLGVMAGGIAHDFNNILVGILGNADLALLDLPARSPVRPVIEDLKQAALRAAALTNQMLAYAGGGRFAIEAVDVNRLIRETTDLIRASVSKKAVLSYQLADNLPPIDADAAQMRQVIMNVIANASDALGSQSGAITISTRLVRADAKFFKDAVINDQLMPGLYVGIEVADTGCGIKAEILRRIFEPFFTTKFAGRGMGLAVVLGVVRQHHGTLKVHSKLGQGTTFSIYCPAGRRPLDQRQPEPATQPVWKAQGTILVIDDEETVCQVSRRMLERMGFNVLTAPDGEAGLALFRQHQDQLAAVLLDMTMPRMNGAETYREMQKIRAATPVLLTSGYTEAETREHLGGLTPAGFIHKPFEAGELVAALRRVLK